jgi:hypothetical protein
MIRIVFIFCKKGYLQVSCAAMVRRWDSFPVRMRELVSPLSRHWIRDIAKRLQLN